MMIKYALCLSLSGSVNRSVESAHAPTRQSRFSRPLVEKAGVILAPRAQRYANNDENTPQMATAARRVAPP
jgi:hypothetical protein